ncbi:MAG TPA: TraR/DksA family transcriptional regulator [Planctomycetota bacterium]|jgi:DnaK suppressor protein|nr:TraR/DksA family transcriptional regulator [Planctomycetota bacterium]
MGSNGVAEGFTQDDLGRFESLLLDRRRLLLRDLQTLEEGDSQNASDSAPVSSHLADLGSDREASDISLGRRESESTEIQEIDDAMERIREGSFGRCESCEKTIARERMEAIPYARLCLPCKTEEEL